MSGITVGSQTTRKKDSTIYLKELKISNIHNKFPKIFSIHTFSHKYSLNWQTNVAFIDHSWH